ncbi:DUF6045 family protein [Ruminococcaceae bacterium OttesenSCG-928-I18]|nr:DUF6045 family protein [Ruminococcaceae bacterium OttesenSCG-928-I18]
MFLWDWALGEVMDAIVDWLYSVGVGIIGALLGQVGMMGYELMELPFVQAVVGFFNLLAWSLYVIGLVVAVFEAGVEYQCGKACLKDTALAAIKGFMAASLFSIVPLRLYKLSIDLQMLLTSGITGIGAPIDGAWERVLEPYANAATLDDFKNQLGDLGGNVPRAFYLFVLIMIVYAFVKVFFASFKRGGILLIQISVGSLYMFSVSRGYIDAFYNWCKQVIGLCLTSFLQGTILTVGLLILKSHPILGLGLMLSAAEVPRIAGMFGLDTSMRVNVMGAVHGAQTAVHAAHTIKAAVGK